MGLLDELDAGPSRDKIDFILNDRNVDQEFKDELVVALIHPNFPSTEIQRALDKRGFKMGESTIRRYRKLLSQLVLAKVKESVDA
jgi:hypothetical protein